MMLTVLPRRVKRLSKYTLVSVDVLDNQDPTTSVRDNRDPERPPLKVLDNQLLFAFWTCLQLERCVSTPTPRTPFMPASDPAPHNQLC